MQRGDLMDYPINDINSVVKLMKSYYTSIMELSSSSLTSLQRKTAEEHLRKVFQDKGITYTVSGSDEREYASIRFNFVSLYVMDTGVIGDVREKGNHPIRLVVAERGSVDFEPRDISHMDSWQQRDINNAEFVHLKKGSTYEFRGKVMSGSYYFNTGRFDLQVDSQHRATVASVFRKLLRSLNS
jgi:hypothetical protein